MSLNDHRWGRHPGPEKESRDDRAREELPEEEVSEEQRSAGPSAASEEGKNPLPGDGYASERQEEKSGQETPSAASEKESLSHQSARDLEAEWKAFNDMLQTLLGKDRKTSSGENSVQQDSAQKEKKLPADGRRRSVRLAAVLALTAFFAAGTYFGAGFYTVPAGQSAALYASGQFRKVIGAGTHWHMPWPFEKVRMVDTRFVHRQSVRFSGRPGEGYLTTADASSVCTEAEVRWQVKTEGVRNYLERLMNPPQAAEAALRRAMQQVFSGMTVRDALSGRAALMQEELKKQVQQEADSLELGISIESVSVGRTYLPAGAEEAARAERARQNRSESELASAQQWAQLADELSVNTARDILESAESYRERVLHAAKADSRYIEYLSGQPGKNSERRAALEQTWNAAQSAVLLNGGSLLKENTKSIMSVIRAAVPEKTAPEKDRDRRVTPADIENLKKKTEAARRSAAAESRITAAPDTAADRSSVSDRSSYLRNKGR